MKNLLLFIFCIFSFCSFGQIHPSMPPEAALFYSNAMGSINPAIKTLIEKYAHQLKKRNINSDSLLSELKTNSLLKGLSQHDMEAISVLIMVQASKNADADLKDLVINMHKANSSNSSEYDKKAQIIIEHKSRIAEIVSLAMKKIPFSGESVINNLK